MPIVELLRDHDLGEFFDMPRRALLIGISQYDAPQLADLPGCLLDVDEMERVLSRHGNDDEETNFDCIPLITHETSRVDRATLRRTLKETFNNYEDEILLYFTGHGLLDYSGGFIVAQDGAQNDPGILMQEIYEMAQQSKSSTITIILDCCNAGAFGQVGSSNLPMRDGMTVMGSSRADQTSSMSPTGMSVFTSLMVEALEGGAANTRGHVTTSSIYAYVDASLGEWAQRPIYKSHARRVEPIRKCKPVCSDKLLREIATYFPDPNDTYQLTRKYEETEPDHDPAKVEIFQKMKKYQVSGLVRPVDPNQLHLYWVAMQSERIQLTTLGQFYHSLVSGPKPRI
ncbi:MAG: caspase family protein [Paracoccaceae bacterium]|nr:caspase family protein [Paracoccaceae bacterium]